MVHSYMRLAGLVIVLLIATVGVTSSHPGHADGDDNYASHLFGAWTGEFHGVTFTLVLFPTGDYTMEMYSRVVRSGTWIFDGGMGAPAGLLRFDPTIMGEYDFNSTFEGVRLCLEHSRGTLNTCLQKVPNN